MTSLCARWVVATAVRYGFSVMRIYDEDEEDAENDDDDDGDNNDDDDDEEEDDENHDDHQVARWVVGSRLLP